MNETLGARICAKRKARGMSQENLAEKLGVSSQAVSKWENDVSCPDIGLLPKLADILYTTTDQLLTGKTDDVRMLSEAERKPLDQLTLRLRMLSNEGDKIKVNLPMTLVKIGLEMGIDIAPAYAGKNLDALKNIDLAKIMDLAEQGMIGKIVEMESADGDTIEVVVE